MSKDLGRSAEAFMASGAYAAKKDAIEDLASSPEGRNVKAMLSRGGFEEAVRRGDTDALKRALAGVLKTEDGARLVRELTDMMGK